MKKLSIFSSFFMRYYFSIQAWQEQAALDYESGQFYRHHQQKLQ